MTEDAIQEVAKALSAELVRLGYSLTEEEVDAIARIAISAVDHHREGKVNALVEAAKERHARPQASPKDAETPIEGSAVDVPLFDDEG
jgi:hypothetical protein